MNTQSLRPLVLVGRLTGAERISVSLARRLHAMGMDVAVCAVTARHDGSVAAELRATGMTHHDLGARTLLDPIALWRLRRLLARERPDVVHAHGQDAAIVAAAARSLGEFPLVLTGDVLNGHTASLREQIRTWAARAAVRRADAAVAGSRAVARRLVEAGDVSRDAIHVIPNGIELQRFEATSVEQRRELRSALATGPDEALVLVPAMPPAGRGLDALFKALPALRARVPAARLLFAGGGEREALRTLARAVGDGMSDAVRILESRTDLPRLLAAADLVVVPSAADTAPTALIEAAAAGRPVVAPRMGEIPEIVVDGVTGLLVPPNDPAAFAEAIATLLLDRARALLYGTAARAIARGRFSIASQIARTLDLWGTVVKEWRRRRTIVLRVSGGLPRDSRPGLQRGR